MNCHCRGAGKPLVWQGSKSIRTRNIVLAALVQVARRVGLDGRNALQVPLQSDHKTLFDAIVGPCVMTPHEGEFARAGFLFLKTQATQEGQNYLGLDLPPTKVALSWY